MAITDEQVKAALDAFYAMSKELLIDENGFIRAATLQTRMRRAIEAAEAAAWCKDITKADKSRRILIQLPHGHVAEASYCTVRDNWLLSAQIIEPYKVSLWRYLPEPPK
jgi:hypothetical protein